MNSTFSLKHFIYQIWVKLVSREGVWVIMCSIRTQAFQALHIRFNGKIAFAYFATKINSKHFQWTNFLNKRFTAKLIYVAIVWFQTHEHIHFVRVVYSNPDSITNIILFKHLSSIAKIFNLYTYYTRENPLDYRCILHYSFGFAVQSTLSYWFYLFNVRNRCKV